ncbi:MAG: hypothetical protein LIR25_04700 [bacterium]|nr:hypothetical protein [bacterium]
MKKALLVLMMVLAAAVLFAETHTIVLVSRVEKQDAQYVIRNNETGAIGASVVYSTEEIAKQDVGTSFDIIQSCDSNGINTVEFTVSATELQANVNGKLYSTKGVAIEMNGRQYGSQVSFTRTTVGVVAAGSAVASFNVIWPTSAELVEATYEACVTLTATAR